jgi:BMFP domain-containing protein YqiC
MRYEEAALQRVELEAVKRENEVLRARVKELEKSLQKANEPTEPAASTPTS